MKRRKRERERERERETHIAQDACPTSMASSSGGSTRAALYSVSGLLWFGDGPPVLRGRTALEAWNDVGLLARRNSWRSMI